MRNLKRLVRKGLKGANEDYMKFGNLYGALWYLELFQELLQELNKNETENRRS